MSISLYGQATFSSAGSGTSWHIAANWTCSGICAGRNYPGETGFTTDNVVINSTHTINLTSAISPTVGNITITDGVLNVRGSASLGVPNLTASAISVTSSTGGAELNVYNNGGGSPNVTVIGDVTISRNSTTTAATRLRIGSDPAASASITSSIVTIGGNLTYTYSPSFSGSEGSTEIAVGVLTTTPNVNDNCRLIVAGNINLQYNFATNSTGNVLALEVGHSCVVSMNDLSAQILESSGTASGSDIRVATKDNQNASITINGNATLNWNDNTAPNGGSNIYLNAGKDDPAAATTMSIAGDLNMQSMVSTAGTVNNNLKASGSSQISLNGNLNFQASAATGAHVENRVELYDNSIFDLKGAINNTLEGSFDFSPTGTISDNSTISFSGNVQQNFPVRFPSGTSYYKNVTINNSSGLPFVIPNTTLQIEGGLMMMNGIINSTSTNQFVFRAAATSNQGTATSYITGPVKRLDGADIILPLGGGTMWAPLGISNITSGTGATFTAQYSSTPHPVLTTDGTFDHVSWLEYWDLSVIGTSPTLDLTLFWKAACVSEIYDLSTGPSQDLFIGHYNGSTWNKLGGTYTISGQPCGVPSEMGSITVTGVSSFSPFTFAAKAPLINPLPVELSDFWAEVTDSNVAHLRWTTESELNSDYFIIEKSIDGKNFYPIDSVAAGGTTNEKHCYEIVDPCLVGGTNYYLLSQKDLDGTIHKYKIISVTISGLNETINLYPVPANVGQPLEVAVRKDFKNEPLIIKAYTTLGHEITNEIEIKSVGLNRMQLTTDHLKPGTYILHTYNSSFSSINRFIVR